MPTARSTSSARSNDPLQRYADKRNFGITPEPGAKRVRTGKTLRFVIQKHWASHLHYDFRLEHNGVLLSWAVPKGPSFDPKDKRMAVHVEDHPVSYGSFEGTIPERQYGAGEVIVWDHGSWEPVGNVDEGLAKGKLVFKLRGEKLAGLWELVRLGGKPGDKRDNWLLFKKHDEWARPHEEYDVTLALPDSVIQHPLGLLEERQQVPAQSGDAPAAAGGEAPRAALPETIKPQLATLAKGPPVTGEWIYELKFDGYRILARIERGKVHLFTRNGHDWTDKMPALAKDIAALGVQSGWLDGEVVSLDASGRPNFNALQNAFDASHTTQLVWYVFDVPYFGGRDLRNVPLDQRRALLSALFKDSQLQHVRFSEALPGEVAELLRNACATGLEGLMAKRAHSPYVHARSEDWLKIKCSQRQEFIVIGYTDRSNGGEDFGSLLLGYHDEQGRLCYAGNVGTGWDETARKDLYKRMRALAMDKPPAGIEPPKRGRWSTRAQGIEHWIKPKLVVEVSFGEWTPDGRIRHSAYQGLREDKPASQVTREQAMSVSGLRASSSVARATATATATTTAAASAKAPAGKSARSASGKATAKKSATPVVNRAGTVMVGGVKVTHADRVIDASTGLTKLDLVRYYESVAEYILPHLRKRPLSLVRAPEGVQGQQFFQKHADRQMIPDIRELDAALWPGHEALVAIDSVAALIQAAQMNVIEFHTWNAVTTHIDKPDRMVFDLDPGEGLTWPQVQEAAMLTKALLDELGLRCWLKTSGGKGLHVVVPFAARLGWQPVKDFSHAVVDHLARTIPSRFVAKSGPKNRQGRVFVDYLRNGESQTTAAAFSARARPGMGVSIPIAWDDLADIKSSDQWTIANARDHLSFIKADPWADYGACKQTLTQAMKRLPKD